MAQMAAQKKAQEQQEAPPQPGDESLDLDALDAIPDSPSDDGAARAEPSVSRPRRDSSHGLKLPKPQATPHFSGRPKAVWIAGTVTFVVGSVINFVAFVFGTPMHRAPQPTE